MTTFSYINQHVENEKRLRLSTKSVEGCGTLVMIASRYLLLYNVLECFQNIFIFLNIHGSLHYLNCSPVHLWLKFNNPSAMSSSVRCSVFLAFYLLPRNINDTCIMLQYRTVMISNVNIDYFRSLNSNDEEY